MLKVTITTATAISEKELSAFKKALTKKYNQPVELVLKTNPQVIGGVKVMVGSEVVDLTMANQLEQLKKQLLKQL
ncbi:MAG: F0F1 ATP synthase subunit delta [Candidatus Paceibacterota bacterium]